MRPVKPWKRASPTDPALWSGYWACRNFADHHGMGVALTGDQLVVVDLDGARDPRNNATREWAKPIIAALGTYAETSPSGEGYHAYLWRGELELGFNKLSVSVAEASNGQRAPKIEIIADRGYATVTHRHHPSTPGWIETRPQELADLVAKMRAQGAKRHKRPRRRRRPTSTTMRAPSALRRRWRRIGS